MALQWSPAELRRQRAIVSGIAMRAEQSRLRLKRARRRLVASVRRTIASPLVIGCVFAAGFLFARRSGSRRRRGGFRVAFGRIRFAALRAMALTQLYSRLATQFRAGWRSTDPRLSAPAPVPAVDG